MFSRVINILDKFLTFFENWTLFLAVIIGLVCLIANVVFRYGFNYSLAWSEELIREIIIFTTFVGCSAAVKNRNMITIDALPQIVPKLKTPLTFFSHAATLFFSVLITYLGYKMAVMQAATFQKTILLEIPLVVLYSILPLMGVMMFIRAIQVCHADIRTIFFSKSE
ncbi:MAG: TRAP transporter small permease subunit [Pseudomonadota bacterium]